jgi:hypothetical protein
MVWMFEICLGGCDRQAHVYRDVCVVMYVPISDAVTLLKMSRAARV